MEQLDLVKILKHAPQGLKLFNDAIKDSVVLQFVGPSYMQLPITTVQGPGAFNIPFTFDALGRSELSTKCELLPAEYASWDNWQYILFPKSVGAFIIDNKTQKIYEITHPDFISPVDIPNTSINMKSLDLKRFSYTTYDTKKADQSIMKVMTDDKYNEFGFDYFDKVLVKNRSINLNDCRNVWTPAVFNCIVQTPMGIMYMADSLIWEDCIPFSKQTIPLIGTSQTFDKNLIKRITTHKKKKNNKK